MKEHPLTANQPDVTLLPLVPDDQFGAAFINDLIEAENEYLRNNPQSGSTLTEKSLSKKQQPKKRAKTPKQTPSGNDP
ncbi:MAG: hypothetical protein C9356_12180 [Oleiphilus sp.]|nr:MAG: hypothetical protein C9356_12180 [Oleiphilus sp.]